MNKKNLSVVLAGAMLATTVAPVLAETTVSKEYTSEQLNVLGADIKTKMESKMISNYDAIKAIVRDDTDMDGNKSAFGFKVLDKNGKDLDLSKLGATNASTTPESDISNNVSYDTRDIDLVFASTNAPKLVDCTVQIVERKTSDFKGQTILGAELKADETSTLSYGKSDFTVGSKNDDFGDDSSIYTQFDLGNNKFISSVTGEGDFFKGSDDSKLTALEDGAYYKKVTVTTNKQNKLGDDTKGFVTLPLVNGGTKIDATLPLDEKGNVLDYKNTKDVSKFAKFETYYTKWEQEKLVASTPENKEAYKITAVAEDETKLKASDLYDGLVLTAKGTEILSDLTNAAENVGSTVAGVITTPKNALVRLSNEDDMAANKAVSKFTVTYYKNASTAFKTVTVYSSNYKEIKSLYEMLKGGDFKVGIVGGANRYATAVNIAKANSTAKLDTTTHKNIVLVNGTSLVDGLSAAPLAKAKTAPVLLSKADSLPVETKEYLEYLSSDLTSAQKKGVTINLVGGESVLSSSLVKELEDMGFYVKRLGGDNREATSVVVAKEIASTGNNNAAFVVGGNGEADAMAISAVAADKTTPIIVSSVHGISEDALDYLKEKSAKGNVTVVGGESVVSAEEFAEINDSLILNKASRIAGANRYETNAAIIKEFYTISGADVNGIVLAKDGVANKGQLVDALAAANYAANMNAPIVLATDSLSTVQKNELLKVEKASDFTTKAKAVQVGNGVERSVLEAVAGLFGLSNK